jgi:tripartite-type tricarboxylate transporter receptor subunit TctC
MLAIAGFGLRVLRLARLGAAVACVGLAASVSAMSADYPNRVIRLLVPLAPGGPADTIARLISIPLAQSLGQAVIVENRPGAAGNIGMAMAAKADPDGYTFLITSNMFVGNPAVSKQQFYDPVKDFEPMIDFGGSPNVIAAHPGLGFKSLAELITYAKANEGKLTYSTPGFGSLSQLGVELLSLDAGIKLLHVPYAGGSPAVQAAVAGVTQLTVVNVASIMSLIKEGRLVALVQTGSQRWPELPDVKTLSESGIRGADYDTYYSMLAPARTPKPILDRIVKEVTMILQEPEIRERLWQIGISVESGGGPDHLRERIAHDLPMWKGIVEKTGIRTN